MGLDLVEFVMSVEERFGIQIPNEVAEGFVSPKPVIDYLSTHLRDKFDRNEVAEIVWQILVYETGIDRTKFDETSRFIQDMGID